MGTRIKNFVSTGLAPDGRLYAGDLNRIQDQYADLSNFGQAFAAGSISLGEAALILLRYGAGEARLSGALRTDGIIRALGGVYAGAFSTVQRDAIPVGLRPFGLIILNTTTNQLEINKGTDDTPNWQTVGATSQQVAGGILQNGLLANRPSPSAIGIGMYFAVDQNVIYYSDGTVWQRIGPRPGDLTQTMNDSAQPGRILCQGQLIPRTGVYADLFAVWGTKFGAGDGVSTFGAPDLQGRVLVTVAPGGKAEVNTVSKNDGRAANQRNISHTHLTYRLEGRVSGPAASATVITAYDAPVSGDVNNVNYPAYFIVNTEAKL